MIILNWNYDFMCVNNIYPVTWFMIRGIVSYRDLCIAIRIAMPQAVHHDMSANIHRDMHRDTSVDIQ